MKLIETWTNMDNTAPCRAEQHINKGLVQEPTLLEQEQICFKINILQQKYWTTEIDLTPN